MSSIKEHFRYKNQEKLYNNNTALYIPQRQFLKKLIFLN